MNLVELAGVAGGRIVSGDRLAAAIAVTNDSRKASRGTIFVAIGGLKDDGIRYAADAIRLGCPAVVAEAGPPAGLDAGSACWIVVQDARLALSALSDVLAGNPTRKLRVVGITGTNGKTTTSYLAAAGLEAAGVPAALIGTIETRACGRTRKSSLTTPEAPVIHGIAAEQVECGGGALVFEVSSHALKLRRADHVDFDAAVFTNLTQDHLDFHPTWDDYLGSKRRLFAELLPADGVAVVNSDDPWTAEVTRGARARLLTYSMDPSSRADLKPLACESGIDGFRATLATPWGKIEAGSRLVGSVNVLNFMAALGATASLGLDPAVLAGGMGRLAAVPGRLACMAAKGGRRIFVDYSHTPDAVRAACEILRPMTAGKLWVVIGCGGDRDRGKRPKMGRAAGEGGHIVVVTSDNPRTEDPMAIIDMIVPGVEQAGLARRGAVPDAGARGAYYVEPDRARAIRIAIEGSSEGDTVLVAGKGHEDYQIFADRTIHFSDLEVVGEILGELGLAV